MFHPGLLPFNQCCLHKVYNGYHKEILVYGTEVENLTFDLNSWFKVALCEHEDFMQVAAGLQNKEIFQVFSHNEALFYHQTETHWVTLVIDIIHCLTTKTLLLLTELSFWMRQ